MRVFFVKSYSSSGLKFLKSLIILTFLICFTACDSFVFNKVDEYFDYYTNTAGIAESLVESSIGKGNVGIDCIESNDNKTVTLLIRNPKRYTLDFTYTFEDSNIGTEASGLADSVRFVQAETKDMASLIFSRAFLQNIEMGAVEATDSSGNHAGIIKNLSGTIQVREHDSQREFDSFHVNVMVNSAPPRVREAMFQRDSNQYIICFYIQNLYNTVHEKDTTKLSIGNEVYNLSFNSSGIGSITRSDGGTVKLSSTRPSGLLNVDMSAAVFSNSAPPGYISLYYETGLDPSQEVNATVSSNLILEDNYGFSSPVYITNTSPQLNPISLNIQDGNSYSVDDDTGLFTITLNHDRSAYRTLLNETTGLQEVVVAENAASAPRIFYNLYRVGSAEPLKSGSGTAPVSLPVERGQYYIKAYASYSGFVDSKENSGFAASSSSPVTILRSANYYVNAAGNEITGNGSRNAPFKSIQKCIDQIIAEATADTAAGVDIPYEYNIYLQSDITALDTDDFSTTHQKALMYFDKGSLSNSISFTVNGNGYKIDAARSASLVEADTQDEGRVICIRDAHVKLKNVTISGGYLKTTAESGAGILKITGASGGTLGLYNTSIKNNTAPLSSAISFPTAYAADVVLANVTITGNRTTNTNSGAIHVNTNNHFRLYGNCQIKDNYKGASGTAKANFYLNENAYICLGRDPTTYPAVSGSVGVSVAPGAGGAVRPTPGHPVQVSNGFSDCCNVEPYNLFTSDDPNKGGIIYNEERTEAVLSGSYATFALVNGETITVTCTSTPVSRNGTVTVTVKDADNHDVTSNCTFANHMLMYGSDVLSGPAYYTPNGNRVTLISSGITETGSYALFVQITYKGFTYDAILPFAVN